MTNALQILQQNPLFKDVVPIAQLTWLVENSKQLTLAEGADMFVAGEPVDNMYIVLEGRIDVHRIQAGQKFFVSSLLQHNITGLLPYSRLTKAMAYGVAVQATQILAFPREKMPEMIKENYELTEALVHLMTSRVREFTQQQQMNEKLISLGKLSAGLAHELNNPVSAVVRSAEALQKHLSNTPERFKKVISIKVTEQQVDEVNGLIFERIQQREAKKLSLMQQNDLEDELLDWLEDHQVESAYDIAPVLVEFGFEVTHLEKVKEIVTETHTDPVINWIANNLITEKIVLEIQEASTRIAHLIGSIKSYSHMDKATDKTKTDLTEGLRNTLTLLQHKIKTNKIQVETDFPNDFPLITGFAGELNQVWTNLIDNAIDAMDEGGKLHIKAIQDREFVVIEINDNGKGIPQELLSQIFDPFFTTKEIGKGTGLGLDFVQKIVSSHHGKVNVKSEKGNTTFSICLPIEAS